MRDQCPNCDNGIRKPVVDPQSSIYGCCEYCGGDMSVIPDGGLPDDYRVALDRIAALEAALRGVTDPDLFLDEEMTGKAFFIRKGKLLEFATRMRAARAALAGAPRPKAECETNDTNAPEGAKEEP